MEHDAARACSSSILLHEESATGPQISLAVRLAGFEPPGDHDLFYGGALK